MLVWMCDHLFCIVHYVGKNIALRLLTCAGGNLSSLK